MEQKPRVWKPKDGENIYLPKIRSAEGWRSPEGLDVVQVFDDDDDDGNNDDNNNDDDNDDDHNNDKTKAKPSDWLSKTDAEPLTSLAAF